MLDSNGYLEDFKMTHVSPLETNVGNVTSSWKVSRGVDRNLQMTEGSVSFLETSSLSSEFEASKIGGMKSIRGLMEFLQNSN